MAVTVEAITPDQEAAVVAFAARHGRFWKRDLNTAWWTGTDANEPNGHLLRQVRNRLGPRWLIKYRLPCAEQS